MRKRRNPTSSDNNGKQWAAAILIALVGGALFLNTLGHELVFDDVTLILQNPLVTSLDWKGIVVDSGYRPVRTLTYALNYAVSGEKPFSYHLVNVILHAANILLLFRLVWRLTASSLMAGLAAAWFACHPVQTAAVAYVSGRKDLLSTLFLLIALLCFLSFRQRNGGRLILASATGVAFLLALGSKEVAIVFPAVLLLADAYLRRGELVTEGSRLAVLPRAVWSAVRGHPALYGSFAALAGAGLYWALAISKASRMESYWGGSLETNLGTGLKLFVHYVKLALVPYPLVADYLGEVFRLSSGLTEPATLGSAAVLIGYLVVALWIFQQRPLASLGMLWFLLALIPVLQLIPFHELAADHFLYLPMAGWSILVAALLKETVDRAPVLAWPVVAAVLLVFGVMTFDRNQDWKTKASLWEATLRDAPGSYRANVNLGQIYFSQGQFDRGIELTRRGLELAPDRSLPAANLGAMYYTIGRDHRTKGRLDDAVRLQRQAREQLERAVQLDPRNPFTISNLANTYKEEALILDERAHPGAAAALRQRARDLLDGALKVPDRRREVQAIWMNYAGLFLDAGEYRQAIPYLERFLAAFPDDVTGNYWMGVSHFQIRSWAGAVRYLEVAVRGRQTEEIWEKLALSYEQLGRREDALGAWRRGVQSTPGPGVHYGLARMLAVSGDVAGARVQLARALALDRDQVFADRIGRLLEELSRGQ